MDNLTCQRLRVINLYRVSSEKQFELGNSIEDQKNICRRFNKIKEHILVKEFELVESGAKEDREKFTQVLNFCKDPKNKINALVVKRIDRLTRQGVMVYSQIKADLAKHGIELLDTEGYIQPYKNTLEDLGLSYPWSIYSPSEQSEIAQSSMSKEEHRNILTRLIRAEARYTRAGYAIRQAPPGFVNAKIETDMGRRTIRLPDPKEARWFITMFKLRAEGVLSDKEIVDKLNSQGYKSRRRYRRDKTTKRVIGYIDGKPLTVKQLQRYITKPIYAGYICELWTRKQPVKAKFIGLVDVETFNKANRGKVMLVEDENGCKIFYNQKPYQVIQKKTRYNPLFPFKEVLCPICNKSLMGSSPRSKSGKHIPTYHCARGHKYWGLNKIKLEETVYNFIKKVKFSQNFIKLLKEAVIDVWNTKKDEAFQESIDYGRRVEDLKAQKLLVKDKIKSLSSLVAIKAFEEDMEKIELDIALASEKRNQTEQKEVDIQELVNYTSYFMEHLSDLLIVPNNPVQQRALFSLLFDTMPNYDEIMTGTLKLSQCFELNKQKSLSKGQLVTRLG
jgi:DNA invertase Pin-like site-specific DNA recombinase